jgi:hypothetical protein
MKKKRQADYGNLESNQEVAQDHFCNIHYVNVPNFGDSHDKRKNTVPIRKTVHLFTGKKKLPKMEYHKNC